MFSLLLFNSRLLYTHCNFSVKKEIFLVKKIKPIFHKKFCLPSDDEYFLAARIRNHPQCPAFLHFEARQCAFIFPWEKFNFHLGFAVCHSHIHFCCFFLKNSHINQIQFGQPTCLHQYLLEKSPFHSLTFVFSEFLSSFIQERKTQTVMDTESPDAFVDPSQVYPDARSPPCLVNQKNKVSHRIYFPTFTFSLLL